MKQYILLIALAIAFASCGNKQNPEPAAAKTQGKAVAGEPRIAYVEIDSFATQYQFCIDQLKELENTQNTLKAQIEAKGRALESAGQQFYTKLQNGEYTSQAEAEKAQAALQRQQQELETLQANAATRMDNAQTAYLEELHKRLEEFIKDFNKDGRFAYILSKSGDNMLYADPKLDITKEVIDGMNKRYKK